MVERQQVIQALIDKKEYKTYLEIGVLGGGVFFDIRCSRKIAVDPEFRFNWKGRLGETIRNPRNVAARYFEVTSDEFFAKKADDLFNRNKIDIALIDGMHEFDYVLNDVNNCLRHLSNNGVLVLHDCNPLTPDAEVPFEGWKARGFTGFWNGDVWKVIPYLRKYRPDLEVFVGDCDHGLGIIMKKGQSIRLTPTSDIGREEFRDLKYEDLAANREDILNLKPESYLLGFLQQDVV
jgi:hypothetical protein